MRANLLKIAFAGLAVGFSTMTLADVPQGENDNKIHIGTGVICDTKDQVTHFVQLIGKKDPREAMTTINREASNPAACGMATVAFRGGKPMGEVRTDQGVFTIMEIEIIAGNVNGGWHTMTPSQTQYTALPAQGIEI